MMRAAIRLVGLLLWMALLGAVAVLLPTYGVATPQVTDLAAWGEWLGSRPPVEGAFGIIQVAVGATAWYLLGVTTIGAVARVLRLGRLVQLADLVTLPPVRRLLQAALGVGLATASFAGVGGQDATSTAESSAPATPAVVSLERQMAESGNLASIRLQGAGGETLRYLGSGDAGTEQLRLAREAQAAATQDQADPDPGPRVWTVQPGEHFWGMAEQLLTESWQRPPTDAEVVPYWQELIETNREALADPANPDLVFPGQEFTVPDPPGAP